MVKVHKQKNTNSLERNGTELLSVPPYLKQIKNVIIVILFFLLVITPSFSNKYNWDSVYFERKGYVVSIDNADSMNVMALFAYFGAFRFIIKSSDAGISWKSVYYDTTLFVSKMVTPREIAYPTKDFCIATSDSNYYVKTTDGGSSWKEYRIDTLIEERGLQHVNMYDDKHGIMTSTHFMYISDDGFETWRQVTLPGWYYILSIFMISPDIITFIGIVYDGSPNYDEKFFRSNDAGKTWIEYPYPDYIFPYRIRFVDSLNGIVAGSDKINIGSVFADLIYKTTDGGETWKSVLDSICILPYGLQDMDMFDKDNGIAVGQAGKIYWTHDGGNTWERDSNVLISKRTPATLRTCMLGKNTALIGDFGSKIYRSSLVPDGVEEREGITDEFSIVPNPAEDFIEISEGTQHAVSEICIFNVFGEELLKSSVSNNSQFSIPNSQLRINVSDLPSGVYFVRVGSKVRKFVKI